MHSNGSGKSLRNILFYCAWIAIPVIQFILFYVVVNFNSITLSFKSYTLETGFQWAGFDTFKYTFEMIFKDASTSLIFKTAFKNSLILLGVSLFVGIPCALLFSFYIYKKFFGSKFFRVMLFLPSILSTVVLVAIYSKFVDIIIPEIAKTWFNTEVKPLLSNPDTQFGTILFYCVFTSFGTSTLLYSSSMSSVSPSLTEAARLDGANWWKEFFHVVLPQIYPTIVVFIVVAVAGIFTNQMCLYTFYPSGMDSTDCYTLGYYLFILTLKANENYTQMPYVACLGIYFSIIVIPLTFLVRWLLNKFGPSTEQ